MSEKSVNNFLLPPSTTTISVPTTAPQTLQSSGSATGNPRNKCALKPGHSLMDWIRLGNSGIDLSGTRGRTVSVTTEELAKHNTREDAWMAIRGVVYNVTKYMDFHPGGVEELMRGVGKDATKLFNEVHAWVNYQQLLNKCRIGPLKNSIKLDAVLEESFKTNKITSPTFAKPPRPPSQVQDITPRLDWIQKRNDLTLYFYTKQFCNPGTLIRRNLNHQDNQLEIWILIGLYLHKYEFILNGRIKWPPKAVNISPESGKIEVNFDKHDEQIELWTTLGEHHVARILANSLEEEMLMDFKLTYRKQFNDDSFIILLTNENVLYKLPIGYHISLEALVNDKTITKCYTPVPQKYLQNINNLERDVQNQHFLIKRYTHPKSLTSYICQLPEHSVLKVSIPKGNFKLSSLTAHRRLCFLAAGSGLTPFLTLIDPLLKRNTNRLELLKLMYFNKTFEDIWCNDILTNMAAEDERFEFINVLSNADESWTGAKGRVNTELLSTVVSNKPSNEKVTFIAVCGPTGFNQSIEEILSGLEFPKENLFIF